MTGGWDGKAARRKGRQFQAQVAKLLAADGWHVQNVGSGVTGTDLIATRNGTTLYVETKHQERHKLPEWWRQTVANTPAGAVPLLVAKQSGEPILWVSGAPPR